MNIPLVVGDDAIGNGQPQPRSPLACREIGEKQFVAVSGRNALPVVPDGQLDRLPGGKKPAGQGELFAIGLIHGLQRIVDQIDQHPLELFRIHLSQGEVGSQLLDHIHAVEAAVAGGQGALDDGVEVGGHHAGRGQLGESGECIHHSLQGLDFLGNGVHAILDGGLKTGRGRGRGAAAEPQGPGSGQVLEDSVSRKLNRGQWILDLVSHAPSHLSPCGGFLGSEQLGQVLQDHYESLRSGIRRIQRAEGDRAVEGPRSGLEFQLLGSDSHPACLGGQAANFGQVFGLEQLRQGQTGVVGPPQHLLSSLVHGVDG